MSSSPSSQAVVSPLLHPFSSSTAPEDSRPSVLLTSAPLPSTATDPFCREGVLSEAVPQRVRVSLISAAPRHRDEVPESLMYRAVWDVVRSNLQRLRQHDVPADAILLDYLPLSQSHDVGPHLAESRPDVLHLYGHMSTNGMVMQDTVLSIEALGDVLSNHRSPHSATQPSGRIRCLLLTGCTSAGPIEQLLTVVPAIIATIKPVTAGQCIIYCEAWYQSILQGHSIDTAHTHGCSALEVQGRIPSSAQSPFRLYTREQLHRDTVLFAPLSTSSSSATSEGRFVCRCASAMSPHLCEWCQLLKHVRKENSDRHGVMTSSVINEQPASIGSAFSNVTLVAEFEAVKQQTRLRDRRAASQTWSKVHPRRDQCDDADVDLRFSRTVHSRNELSSTTSYRQLQSVWELLFTSSTSIPVKQLFQRGSPLECSSRDAPANKVLILGQAGIGKTVMCKYIAFQWAQGELWSSTVSHSLHVSRHIDPNIIEAAAQCVYDRALSPPSTLHPFFCLVCVCV